MSFDPLRRSRSPSRRSRSPSRRSTTSPLRIRSPRLHECDHCHEKFETVEEVQLHMLDLTKCPLCNTIMRSQKDVDTHLRDDYYATYACNLCDFKSHALWVVRKHINAHHPGHLQDGFRVKYIEMRQPLRTICTMCVGNVEFPSTHDFYTHVEEQHRDKLKCDACQVRFDGFKSFDSHARLVHNFAHVCEVCGASLVYYSNYIKHKELKHNK